MFSNFKYLNFFQIFLILLMLLFQSCGMPGFKKTDVKDVPINDADKRKKNIEEGRGLILGGNKNKTGGNFDFATSNEMWRASLDVLEFVPLTTVDYGGGVIITDWYSDDLSSNESIKIIVNFLSNEIRVDGLKIKIYKKTCKNNLNCETNIIESNLNNEIKIAILKKAAQIKKNSNDGADYTVVDIKDK
jgi:hypothetical protein